MTTDYTQVITVIHLSITLYLAYRLSKIEANILLTMTGLNVVMEVLSNALSIEESEEE